MASMDEGKAAGLAGEPRKPPYPEADMEHHFWLVGWDSGDRDRRATARTTISTSGRQQGKTHAMRIQRLRAIAKGATINGTYKMLPEPALEAFRADLLALVGDG